MKKVALLFAVSSILMFSSVFAQIERRVEAKTVEVENESHESQMEEELGLSEEQKAEMKAIKEKYAPKEKAQRDQMKALKESMKQLREEKRKEMHEVLTPEQKKKAEAHHEEMMKRKKAKKAVQKKKMQHRKEMHK